MFLEPSIQAGTKHQRTAIAASVYAIYSISTSTLFMPGTEVTPLLTDQAHIRSKVFLEGCQC